MEGTSSVDNKRSAFLRTIALAGWCAFAVSSTGSALRAQQEPVTARSAAVRSATGPKARQLLDQAGQALGGPALLNFKNGSTSGRVFGFSNGEMAGVQPFKRIYAPPDKRRFTYGKSKP